MIPIILLVIIVGILVVHMIRQHKKMCELREHNESLARSFQLFSSSGNPYGYRQLKSSLDCIGNATVERLREKGTDSWRSTHQILGLLTEEYHEFIEAVQSNDINKVRAELLDIGVIAHFGIACIDGDDVHIRYKLLSEKKRRK